MFLSDKSYKNKPLLNAVGDEGLVDTFRKILKSFYGVIKGEDAHIRFVFITGVTRFDKVSIFSDQTGYLTIKDYEKEFNSYTIGLPNDEVKFCLYKRLLPLYAGFYDDDKKIEIVNFLKALRAGKVDEFMERINAIFAAAPKKTSQKRYELDCQAFVWLIFKLMGEFVLCEVQNGKGRSDAVVWERGAVYIFEFKMDGSAEDALKQIDSKDYPISYKNEQLNGRKIVKIGLNYSSAEEQLTDWKISEV